MSSYLINRSAIKAKTTTANSKKPGKGKIKTFLHYCNKNIKHFCFKVENHGWFCMRKDPISKNFVLASVSKINNPNDLSKYISDNIKELHNRSELAKWLIKNIQEKEDRFYHNGFN